MTRPIKLLFLSCAIVIAACAVQAQTSSAAIPKSSIIDAAALLNDVKTLSADAMEGRSPAQPSMQKARDYVTRRFRESGIQPIASSYEQEFPITSRDGKTTYKGVNYVGLIKGKKIADRYIVVTAHYDHVGVRNGVVYNGADDNASGTSALFAIAKALQKDPPEHSVIIVAFDAEEMGLRGSRYFVENLPVKKEDILLNINMDMVSRNDKGELYASGAFRYPMLRATLEKAQKQAKVKLILGHDDPKLGKDDWTDQSDQGSFNKVGIPFVYFGVEDHADYHKPTDDFERIMPEFYVHAVETVLQTVKLFDKDLAGK
jgi:Zn-dependent M28 family amino/carboxypeptidase